MKRNLSTIFIGLILLVSGSIQAQLPTQSDVTIRSNPAGAKVSLKGETLISGLTPVRFRHLLIGDYAVKVTRFGYEDYNTRVTIDPALPFELSVKLTPKTRFKATLRSMLIPGWGQRYTGRKTKGWLMTTLSAASVAAFFVTDIRLGNKEDDFFGLRTQYDSDKTFAGRQRLQPFLDKAQKDAFDAENYRRAAIVTVASIWGLNVLDALFAFPARQSTLSVKGVSLAPSVGPKEVGVSLTRNF